MNQVPEAVFVVERRPGQGYGVTSSWGPRATALLAAAVEVLNELGQPDPRGPEEVQRWVPDAGPNHQPLFVRIRRTPEGESVYHQAWFPPNTMPLPTSVPSRARPWWLVAGLVLLLVGGVLGWTWRGPGETVATPGMEKPETKTPTVKTPEPVVSATSAELPLSVRRSQEARKKLDGFLQQPGLAGWPEEGDVIETTIELRDFRKTTRGIKIEPTYLTNDEVRALRKLLANLGKIEN